MVDLHCHVLPQIDDGSNSMDTTIEMCRIAKEDGINKIIATPHFYYGYYENSFEDSAKLTHELNIILKENDIDIEILPGQEIMLNKNMLKFYKEGIIKGLNGTSYMLIELEPGESPEKSLDIIYELKISGINPILAHPERYEFIINKPENINSFIEEGCLFQINSNSIEGTFGKEIKKTADILIKHRLCHFIASDAHTTRRRSPRIKNALTLIETLDPAYKTQLIQNPYDLLDNKKITQPIEKIQPKKKLFSFLK